MSADEPRTLTELSDYIQSLVAFGDAAPSEGYEKSADAMWKAALATFNLVAREVGATGFQGSWAALRFYGEAMRVEGPFGVYKLEDALYPQYDLPARLQAFIDEHRDWLAEQAREKLADNDRRRTQTYTDIEGNEHPVLGAHPDVVAHWRALAARQTEAAS